MKITCQACQAKYTIADEKVAGKIVKIRCKKCGASIVVNGTDPSAVALEPPPPSPAFDNAGSAGEPSTWTVNVADGDQRTMTEAEIAVAHGAGMVTDDTFCWKEGMADWLPVHEVPALVAACNARAADGAAARPMQPPSRVSRMGNGAPGLPATATLAARRTGRMGAPDLFSGAARAGGEDEVMTSVPAAASPPRADTHRLPGGRNDNSPLFGFGPDRGATPPPPMTATTEASGLIDIRQLGAQMRAGADEKKRSRVDDIMNLGGAFSPSLAAPVLTAPSLEHYAQSSAPAVPEGGPAGAMAKNKALVFLALGAGTFFLVAAIGMAVVLVRGKGPAEERDKTSGRAAAAPSSGAAAAAAAPTQTTQPLVQAPAPPPLPAPPPTPPIQAATASPAKEPAAKEFKAAAYAPVKEAPQGASQGAGEFNLGEARSRLAAIANGVQTCKRGETSGGGKVELVFSPSGAVQSATLVGGSPFEGTPTGKCVEARFRQAHITPFSGGPVPVTKSFNIN